MHKSNPLIHKLLFFLFLLGLICHIQTCFCQISSPLHQGKWIKVAVTQSQFYHLNQNWFSKHKIPVLNPAQIALYGVEPGMLAPNKDPKEYSLKAIPAFYQLNSGNSWEIMFWGDAPHAMYQQETWRQETNRFSDTTFYFVQIDASNSNSIEEINPPASTGINLNYAYSLKHYEPETYNVLQSGQTWLGDAFFGNGTKFLQYSISDYFEGKPAYLEAKFYASSIGSSSFTLTSISKSINLSPITGGRYDSKASNGIIKNWISPVIVEKNWSLPIQFQSSGGTGYIDFISLCYPRVFDAANSNPLYLLPNTKDSTISIAIPNLSAQQQIWISNGGARWLKIANNKSFQFTFKPNSKIAIADIKLANEPIFCGPISNYSTFDIPESTELLVLSSPTLAKEAEKLANYKASQRGIASTHVDISKIYQDFSGGKQDVTAIRNFIQSQYQKPGSKLKYVILLGDASVDYKGQNVVSTALEKSCFVPTYQSKESFQPLFSYASDDFFGIVGTNSGDWNEGFNTEKADMQVAIGRIPAKNPREANMFINKLMAYEERLRWRPMQIAWVADDGDGNIHMQDAEDFSKFLLKETVPGQQKKIYLDQYPMNQSNGVYTSPMATKAALSLFNEVDFIHYTGHGSESGLTDEKLLTTNDIVELKNNQNLPILLTATCQFGRFDDPNILSGGELSLLSDQGGAIALISTTRPVFQSSNYLFGQAFYRSLTKNRNTPNYRIGDLFRDAKNLSQSGVINRNIQLLGDPSLKLPWTSEFDNIQLDSVKQTITLRGADIANREISLQLHRLGEQNSTLGTKGVAYQYETISPIIWKSSGISQSNTLTLSLQTLPNLNLNQDYQIIAWSEKNSSVLPIKRWQNKQIPDQIIPKISISLLNEVLQSSSRNPIVQLNFADSSGLAWQNNMGKTAFLLLDDSVKIELGPLVKIISGNPKLAAATIPLKNLSYGTHKIQAYCWDIYNNYAQTSLEFQVNNDENNVLFGRLYPNPLSRSFHFVFEQIKPWNRMPYEIEVFNPIGQLLLKRSGFSQYQGEQEGIIAFDWTENEWQKMDSFLIFNIRVMDELKNETKTFQIKTSTLK